MRDHPSLGPELGEPLATALAVHDDSVEVREQLAPETGVCCSSPRQQVVRGEDRRRAKPQMHIRLRKSEPLQVQHVGTCARERAHYLEVLDRLQRQPQA